MIPKRPRVRTRRPRRGGVYVAVLGASMLVTLIGLGAMAAVRAQRLQVNNTTDMMKARLYAEAGLELGVAWVRGDPNWRSNRTPGLWASAQPIGDGTFAVEVRDAVDSSFTNRPYDPIYVRGIGVRGNAQQIVQATMTPKGVPMDLLGTALHASSQIRVRSGRTLTAQGAPVSTNGGLRNDGTIDGSVECTLTLIPGTITGSLTLLVPDKPMPSSGLMNLYVNLGTVISPGGTIDRAVLTPTRNPWGTPDADGLYVINLSSDLTIRNTRLQGTLVIRGSGRRVTIEEAVFFEPARADYPVIITDAELLIRHNSAGLNLSEASLGTNFNPANAPYLGETDNDQSDTYPNEIRGVVHTRDVLEIESNPLIRGLVIVEAKDSSEAVDVDGNLTIIYDPALFASPPVGYTKSVEMVFKPGSWTQVVSQ